jgi:chemotaxis protein MotB
MRHSVTRWRRRPRSRFVAYRTRPGVLLLACLPLAFGTSACVTRGSFDEVAAERDALARARQTLEKRIERIEASNQSLDAERVRLIDESEDLGEVRATLERDVARLQKLQESLSESLEVTETQLSAQSEEVTRLRGTYEGLVADLEAEVSSGQIEIERLREGIRLNVSDEILFASGSAELGDEGAGLLRKVAAQLKSLSQRVEVQGHTDDVPIRGALAKTYPTNWELAGARAARVARLLQEEGVEGARLTAVSYGEHHPVAPNETPEERSLNRRIEIRLLPPEPGAEQVAAEAVEPVTEAPESAEAEQPAPEAEPDRDGAESVEPATESAEAAAQPAQEPESEPDTP